MDLAIEIARGGFPAPNPHVGCVIVRDGRIVGQGYHRYAGAPHAEAMALEAAGSFAKGADVYVTQEPCNHFGRTPPCSEALVRAGVERVFVAVPDPNPIAQGGTHVLRKAGIEVIAGVRAHEAALGNWLYLDAMKSRRARVVAKAAVTADGFMARLDGTSKWITGPTAREEGHRLRAEMGAVLVGRRTVECDDPELTARIPDVVNQPLRIVLDPQARLRGNEKVFDSKAETVWVVAEGRRSSETQWEIPFSISLDLEVLLRRLFERGTIGVLVEGGPRTLAEFFKADLVDRVALFQSQARFGNGIPFPGSVDLEAGWQVLLTRGLAEDNYSVFCRVREP